MTGSTDNRDWAFALMRGLAVGGLRHVVVSPGSRSTPLVLACAAMAELEVHTVLDERSAGFYALGLARVSGRAVALVCTSGSAGAHYLPAVIEAHHTRVPLVLLTADRPAELQGCGAGQTINQVGLFGAQVRRSFNLEAPRSGGSPLWLRTVAARALDAAEGGQPGPVHINAPFRKPLWSPEDAPTPEAPVGSARILRGPTIAHEATVSSLADRLEAVERGVFVCGPWWPGQGAVDAHAEAIVGLAEALGWPVIAEPTSQLRFGPWARGHVIASGDALLRGSAAALEPEIIVQIGQAPTSKAIGAWIEAHGAGKTVLIDPDGVWRDPTHSADLLVVSDAGWLCRAVSARIEARSGSGWLRQWRALDEAAEGALRRACAEGVWEGAVAREVVSALPEGAALHVASSMPIRDLDGFVPRCSRRITVLSSRGANGIDGTIATALGESRAWGEGASALLIGDLAFLHDAGSLLTVRGDLTVVVVNNGGGGIFGFLPIKSHPTAFDAHFLTPQTARIDVLCEAAGARHTHATTMEGLKAALDESLGRGGVSVIEVAVDRRENMARHEAAQASVEAAVSGGLS